MCAYDQQIIKADDSGDRFKHAPLNCRYIQEATDPASTAHGAGCKTAIKRTNQHDALRLVITSLEILHDRHRPPIHLPDVHTTWPRQRTQSLHQFRPEWIASNKTVVPNDANNRAHRRAFRSFKHHRRKL